MRSIALVLALLAAIALAACGGSSATAPDASAPATAVVAAPADTEAPAATEAPTADPNAAHAIGEVVDIGKGATMTVESAAKNADGDLVVILAVDNSAGSESLAMSSMIGFEAKDADGNKGAYSLQLTPPEGANTPLDGTVAPGDKLRGYLAFKGLGAGAKLVYLANLFGSDRVTWDLGQ